MVSSKLGIIPTVLTTFYRTLIKPKLINRERTYRGGAGLGRMKMGEPNEKYQNRYYDMNQRKNNNKQKTTTKQKKN